MESSAHTDGKRKETAQITGEENEHIILSHAFPYAMNKFFFQNV